jgi:hypothetical protein
LSVSWKDKKLTAGSVLSSLGGVCRIRAPGELNVSLNGKPVAVKRPAEGIVVFETSAGVVYELR